MKTRSLQSRLIQALALIAVVAVAGVLAVLPYRLYSRDIRHARVEAHRLSSVIHAALSEALDRREDVTDLTNRMQSIADFDLQLTKLAPGVPHPAHETRKALDRPFGTELTYVAPPILDGDGNTWLAEMHFDLSPMKRDSVRLIIDLVLLVALGSLAFSAVIFGLVRNGLVLPIRRLTELVSSQDPDVDFRTLPEFASEEMTKLANALARIQEAGR
jgi:hypothetical protein